jgi:Cu/Ag efflux protein CusF
MRCNRTIHVLAFILFLFSGLEGCSNQVPPAARTYDFPGVVTSIDVGKPAVTIDHQDVPGLMSAMEMEFPVRDPAILEGLSVGDRVTGEFQVDPSGQVVTRLKRQ